MNNEQLRAIRNKALWTSAFRRCGKGADRDDVAYVRGDACVEVTSRTRGISAATADYKELTLDELQHAINYVQRGVLPEVQYIYASAKKMAFLHRMAMQCALYYAPMPRFGEMSKADVQNHIASALKERKRMQPSIQKALYEWINPTVGTFLSAYQFEQDEPNPMRKGGSFVQWNSFTDSAAQYVINRFTAMYAELTERYTTHITLEFSEN